MIRGSCVFLLIISLAGVAKAATHNIMVTGFWPPTNEMVKRFSTNPALNPGGWLGKNYRNSGYDVYAYFPQFDTGDRIGTGDFRVDYAATFNDFMKYTGLLQPIALLSFGNGGQHWTLEVNYLPYFVSMFASGVIPSEVGVTAHYKIPESLKREVAYHSSLPVDEIRSAVPGADVNSAGDPGDFLCGFMAYLDGWYHAVHSATNDPQYNAMAGFIHVDGGEEFGANDDEATIKTIDVIIDTLERGASVAGAN